MILSKGVSIPNTLLSVDSLCIGQSARPDAPMVRDIRFTLNAGECLGIAGESGSGKTLTACALCGLLPPSFSILSGSVCFCGKTLNFKGAPPAFKRGRDLLYLFQSPSGALNPTVPSGHQLAHAIKAHERCSLKAARIKARALVERVGLHPEDAKRYPFQLSGGQRQRVLLAFAFGLRPRVLIADEPTAGQDDENQSLILALLERLQRETGTAVLLISHDLRVLSRLCQQMLVLYRGCQVESGPSSRLLDHPVHPHTRELVTSMRYLEERP